MTEPIWWAGLTWKRSHRIHPGDDYTLCGQHIRNALYKARRDQPQCRNCLKVLGDQP